MNQPRPSKRRPSIESAGLPRRKTVSKKGRSGAPLSNVMSIRGTLDWRDWLGRFAAQQRMTPTAVIDQALAEAARRAGFEEPPPRY